MKVGVPISAPGSTVEDLENDRAALDNLARALECALDYGFQVDGDPDGLRAWVKGRLQETENSIDALTEPRCDDPGAHGPGCHCNGGEPVL